MYTIVEGVVNIQTKPVEINVDTLKIGNRNFTHSMLKQLQEVIYLSPGSGKVSEGYTVIGWVNYRYKYDDIDMLKAVSKYLRQIPVRMTLENDPIVYTSEYSIGEVNELHNKIEHKKLILIKDGNLYKSLIFDPKILQYCKNGLRAERKYIENYRLINRNTKQLFIAT